MIAPLAKFLDWSCARMNPWAEMRAVSRRIRSMLPRIGQLCEKLNLTPLNLTRIHPAISKKNILVIEGAYDLMCPQSDVEDLWQMWGQPDIWRLPYGHTGVCCGFVPGLNGRVLRWLTPRLNAATAKL